MLKKAANLSLLAGASLQNQMCELHSLYLEQRGHQTLQGVSGGVSCTMPRVFGVIKETVWLPCALLLALSSKRENFV